MGFSSGGISLLKKSSIIALIVPKSDSPALLKMVRLPSSRLTLEPLSSHLLATSFSRRSLNPGLAIFSGVSPLSADRSISHIPWRIQLPSSICLGPFSIILSTGNSSGVSGLENSPGPRSTISFTQPPQRPCSVRSRRLSLRRRRLSWRLGVPSWFRQFLQAVCE